MKIAILSDTHDAVENLEKAFAIIKREKIQSMIHLGDYIAPQTIRMLKGFKVQGIFGNNDGEKFGIQKAFQDIKGKIARGEFQELTLEGRKIALYHGTEEAITQALIKSQQYNIVLHGHTHEPINKQEGKTLSLNPGSLHGKQPSFAVLDLKAMKAEIIKV